MPLAKPPRRSVSASSARSMSAASSTPSRLSAPAPRRHHRVTKLPLAVSVATFLSIIAVMIGALAATAMQRDDEMLRRDLAQSQQTLLDRIVKLEQGGMPATPNTPSAPVEPTPATENAPVSAAQLNAMRIAGEMSNWNSALATTTQEYRSDSMKFSFNVPYNPAWGNATYKVSPFEVDGNVVSFGPVLRKSDGSFYRLYSFSAVADTVEALNKSQNASVVSNTQLAGLPVSVVKLADGSETLRFQGKKYAYSLSEASGTAKTVPMSNATALIIVRSLKAIN